MNEQRLFSSEERSIVVPYREVKEQCHLALKALRETTPFNIFCSMCTPMELSGSSIENDEFDPFSAARCREVDE